VVRRRRWRRTRRRCALGKTNWNPTSAALASNWHDAAEKARCLLNLFTAPLAAQDPRRLLPYLPTSSGFQATKVSGCSNQNKCSPTAGRTRWQRDNREAIARRRSRKQTRTRRRALQPSRRLRRQGLPKKCRRQEVLVDFALIRSPPGINVSRKGNLASGFWNFLDRDRARERVVIYTQRTPVAKAPRRIITCRFSFVTTMSTKPSRC
jgi:hypothetical protein